jgi:UDP-2-acetamido-3-amino-2,3-dideoxy-glucuronate N-acetyltransferase|tara:strand:- start:13390 stop:13965 length:576 start_codon:yes stop_codon:yes gene_type:complete
MKIHETAIVDNGAQVGKGSKIWHFSHIMSSAKIGENVTIGQNCFIGENVTIADNVKIQNNVSLYDGIVVEENVFIGPSAVFTNVKKPRSEYPTNKIYDKTLIRKGATIGANSTVVCGVTLNEYCFLGSGTVATKDIPNNALVVGNPAKIIGWVGESGDRLEIKENFAYDKFLDIKYEINFVDNEIKSIKKI